MDKVAECCTTHFIDEDGTFKADELDNFVKQVKLGACGLSYAVVAIMGPQSSGKSTLLNHLFDTNFKEMDAKRGRDKTTKGIWIARCDGIEPCTIAMDLEGTDGQERGEVDTAFEKQSALFAIAVSHIVIINMWCHEIGRENAANKPLLKTVFQVMLKLFKPRKTTLMFVIRDKTKTPPEILRLHLEKDIYKIWHSLPKPEAKKQAHLSEFFNVEVVLLSNYEEKEDQFKEEVASLRKKFFQSIAPGGLAGDREWVVPGSGFSFNAQQIWKVVKDNKDLDLPSHKIMMANILCETISREKYDSFVGNEDWLELEEVVKSHFVPGFGKKLSLLLDNCLSNYYEEVMCYDCGVASEKRKQLEEKLMQLVEPACKMMFGHIRSKALNNFESALSEGQQFATVARDCINKSMRRFDELCEDVTSKQPNWDTTKIRDEFSCDLNSHITKVRAAKLYELKKLYESNFKEALCSHVEALLEVCSDDTWPAIRTYLCDETETVVSNFSFALASFEIDEQEKEEMISKLKNYARRLIVEKSKTEAGKVLGRMKDRFTFIFNHHDAATPRVSWTNEDIPAITKIAWTSSLKLLSVLAAIRLDEDTTDAIWETLVFALVEPKIYTTTLPDPLASITWKKVTAQNTLINPLQCKSLWEQFQKETEHIVNQARASQEAYNNHNSKLKILEAVGMGIGGGIAFVASTLLAIYNAKRR